MTTLRTPLEVALGTRLPIDFGDVDHEDYAETDGIAEEHRSARLSALVEDDAQ